MIQERYLYHSFPRRGVRTTHEINWGINTLACIRDFGLLLLPELIEWKQPLTGGSPDRVFPVVQSRVCFTDLSPSEVPEHGDRFGKFALEFEVESLRGLGAIPVFYIPQKDAGVGTALLAILADSNTLVQRAANVHAVLNGAQPVAERFELGVGFARNLEAPEKFSIHRDEAKIVLEALGHRLTPWHMLKEGTQVLQNFFYPADNVHHDKPLEYYRQREWRIACNFAIEGVNILRRPSPGEKERIAQIDPDFFLRPIEYDFGPIMPLDDAFVHPGMHGKSILQNVRRVIAPQAAVEETRRLLELIDGAPPVVSIETIAE